MGYRKDLNILVLADLHNGDKYIDGKIDGLFQIVRKENDIKALDFIFILGDISNCNSEPGINNFGSKFEDIKSEFPNIVTVMIPGNHDLNREAINKNLDLKDKFFAPIIRKEDLSGEINSSRNVGQLKVYLDELNEPQLVEFGKRYFVQYCELYSKIINDGNPFFGIDRYDEDKLILVRVNSAWNAIDSDTDFGNIVLGARQIESLIRRLGIENYKDEYTVITLVHHPPSWWNYNEKYSTDLSLQSPYELLLKVSDIILCGHTHALNSHYMHYLESKESLPGNVLKSLLVEVPPSYLSSENDSWVTILSLTHDHTILNRRHYSLKSSGSDQVEVVSEKLKRIEFERYFRPRCAVQIDSLNVEKRDMHIELSRMQNNPSEIFGNLNVALIHNGIFEYNKILWYPVFIFNENSCKSLDAIFEECLNSIIQIVRTNATYERCNLVILYYDRAVKVDNKIKDFNDIVYDIFTRKIRELYEDRLNNDSDLDFKRFFFIYLHDLRTGNQFCDLFYNQ